MTEYGDYESRYGIMRIFDLFDEDKTGKISIKNLKKIAEELGENFTDSEFEEMMKLSSWNEKEISRDDFYRLFSKKVFF